jgi:hypothetical protein
MQAPTHVIGDIHGQLGALTRLLTSAGLLHEGRWGGGKAQLLFLGDFFNRGPAGLGVLELVMGLQTEAEAAGGSVEMLLGNHDLLILAAYRFGEQVSCYPDTFIRDWQRSGGIPNDLAGLTPAHAHWLSSRPALLLGADVLYMHADATFYKMLGDSPDAVNQTFQATLRGQDIDAWNVLLEAFGEHEAFWHPGGEARAQRFLEHFGAARLVHAHTPISKLTGQSDESVTAPLHYAGGLCTDLDHALYRGGQGFIYRP